MGLAIAGASRAHLHLSGQSIGDRAFHRQALDILTQAGPQICSRLCMEITETAAVTNMADASVFVDQDRRPIHT